MSNSFSTTSMYLLVNHASVAGNSFKVEIGEGKNQVSLSMIYELVQYVNGSKSESEFKDTLRKELYNSLSNSEKRLIESLEKDGKNIQFTVVAQTNEVSVTEYQAKIGIPTDEYLNDLKYAEELDFKSRENNKYFKKMQKISGNTPLGELMIDISGTTIKPSNMHETDWNKLNSFKLESPNFI